MRAPFNIRLASAAEHHPLALGVLRHGERAEIWESLTPVTRGEQAGITYAENGRVLFGELWLPESALADTEAATHGVYAGIETFLAAHGYPHLLRCWNYLHDLHRGGGDAERYRQFVAGRYRAWSTRPDFEQRLPAATVIGNTEPQLHVLFLAAREPGTPIENPRQTPAWKYPREYGPRSPSFARAMRADWGGESHLYVSGTASVVGHESHHAGDAPAQLREIQANIAALLKEAGGGWQPRSIKLYARNAGDLPAAQKLALDLWGADAPFLWALGDICRADLLLEVEAVFSRAADRPSS